MSRVHACMYAYAMSARESRECHAHDLTATSPTCICHVCMYACMRMQCLREKAESATHMTSLPPRPPAYVTCACMHVCVCNAHDLTATSRTFVGSCTLAHAACTLAHGPARRLMLPALHRVQDERSGLLEQTKQSHLSHGYICVPMCRVKGEG